ncbi:MULTISPECIES: ABC transporter ATP-binding protein [unclassified Rothia (in: high G+C Gram-positive bacteria)]|uniref:ABC transporter transmembrane domain-containing protein n=1 Tax=unclassified Rothia (in: high G+C Gram-positive bacteria) TaxID=2689056 RepID=UPI00195D2C57|nr:MULTISPECIES: ABC transporter ATP-binding protein [unclassified Rothia (in: high G+C Gram-positive bacteria)]MBM7050622.1 ABC transporter ATP-binding protein [Rothia sp. ZJ1223]QRZ60816.1 ABC transporter ATP-binding protein [Rothia sp. ZJ932]
MASSSSSETAKSADASVKFRVAPPGWRWRPLYLIPFITDLISVLSVAYMPVLMGRIIDLHIAGQVDEAWSLMKWLVLIVLYFCFNEIFTWGTTFKVIAALERAWRLHISGLAAQAPVKDTGNLIALLNKDSRTLGALWHPVIMASSAVGTAIMCTYQLWIISPPVAVIVLVGLILTVFALTRISKILEAHSEVFREKVGVNTSKAGDIASSIRTILGLGAQERMMRRYSASAHELHDSQLRLEKVQTWSYAARNFLVGTVTLLAIAFAVRGSAPAGIWITDIPAGQLVTVAGLINIMTGPIWSVEMLLFAWRQSRVALRRVDQLTHDVADARRVVPSTLPASVEVPTATSPVVYINPRDFGMTAQDYAEALTRALRTPSEQRQGERILLSEPNPMIFAGTLAEHLQLGTTGLETQGMIELLKLTDSEEIAHRLGGTNPQEYLQARISAEGANLSGGQRQRLALARALAQNTQILVLTEPLNSVDEPSQKFILDELEKRTGTAFPLTHLRTVYIISTTMETERRITGCASDHATARDYSDAITSSIQKIEQTPRASVHVRK